MLKKQIIILLFVLLFVTSCDNNNKVEFKERTTSKRYNENLHTFVNFTAYTKTQSEFDKYKNTIDEVIKTYSPMVSIYVDGGEANLINQKAPFGELALSKELEEIISKCIYYGKLTDGAFDITIKPVFDLWHIDEESMSNQEGTHNPVDPELIKEKLQFVGYENITLKNGKISFKKQGVQILLGGVAKGYILKKIEETLRNQGLAFGIIEIGGDIITFGSKPDGSKWKIGCKNPRPENTNMPHLEEEKDIVYGLELSNMSVVTSGDYEQYYIDSQGNRVHHIIDPKTGYSAKPVISATVIADSILDADILSTAIFVMGPEKGTELIETLQNTESSIIYIADDGSFAIKESSGFNKYVFKSFDSE